MSTSTSGLRGGPGRFLDVFGRNGRLHQWLQALDRILRGEATRPSALRGQSIDLPVVGLSIVLLGLALSYGGCMGMYSGFHPDGPSNMQWLACTLKVPALFFLTLCVTFPSLYVFNALVGSRLYIGSVLQLLVAALAVNLAVLASLGPIVAFFSFSTTSSPFMVLLNVVVFALSGILGMQFLRQTLQRLSVAQEMADVAAAQVERARQTACPTEASRLGAAQLWPKKPTPQGPITEATREQATPGIVSPEPPAADLPSSEQNPERSHNLLSPGPWLEEHSSRKVRDKVTQPCEEPCALDPLRGHVLGRHVKTIFACWMMTFGVVGGQMAWVLRPYFTTGHQDFVWFAPRGSNFFEGVLNAFLTLLR